MESHGCWRRRRNLGIVMMIPWLVPLEFMDGFIKQWHGCNQKKGGSINQHWWWWVKSNEDGGLLQIRAVKNHGSTFAPRKTAWFKWNHWSLLSHFDPCPYWICLKTMGKPSFEHWHFGVSGFPMHIYPQFWSVLGQTVFKGLYVHDWCEANSIILEASKSSVTWSDFTFTKAVVLCLCTLKTSFKSGLYLFYFYVHWKHASNLDYWFLVLESRV